MDWKVLNIPPETKPEDRAWLARVCGKIRVDEHDCWIWIGSMVGGNVPIVVKAGSRITVHRRLWEILKRGGMEMDKKQRLSRCPINPRCVLPAHHEVRQWPVKEDNRTHCRKGHTLDDAYVDKKGRRTCKVCRRESALAYYRKIRLAYDASRFGQGDTIPLRMNKLPEGVPLPVELQEQKIEKRVEPPRKQMKPEERKQVRRTSHHDLQETFRWGEWMGKQWRGWKEKYGDEVGNEMFKRAGDLLDELGHAGMMELGEEELERRVGNGREA